MQAIDAHESVSYPSMEDIFETLNGFDKGVSVLRKFCGKKPSPCNFRSSVHVGHFIFQREICFA